MSNCTDVALFMRSMKGGGAEKVMANIANGLARSGLSVDLVLMDATGQNLKELSSQINVVDLTVLAHRRAGFFKSRTSLQSLRSLFKLIAYLKSQQPSVLLSATHYLNELSIIAKYIAKYLVGVKTRVVVSEHTTMSVEAQRAMPRTARFIPVTSRLLYPFADEVVAVSRGVAQDLARSARLARHTIRVIYNPVVNEVLSEQAKAPIHHPWLKTKQQIPVVVGSGRFVSQKDFSTLIRAFAQIRSQRPARLILLGDGGDRPQLEALVSQLGIGADVWFPGFVTNPYAYMSKADVFVSSSAWEGLPTVLIEALALKLPVVATNCPSGPSEILNNGQYGHLVPVGDASAIATAIEAVLQGDRRLALESHLYQFGFESAIAQYLNLLRQPPAARSQSGQRAGKAANQKYLDRESVATPIEKCT